MEKDSAMVIELIILGASLSNPTLLSTLDPDGFSVSAVGRVIRAMQSGDKEAELAACSAMLNPAGHVMKHSETLLGASLRLFQELSSKKKIDSLIMDMFNIVQKIKLSRSVLDADDLRVKMNSLADQLKERCKE